MERARHARELHPLVLSRHVKVAGVGHRGGRVVVVVNQLLVVDLLPAADVGVGAARPETFEDGTILYDQNTFGKTVRIKYLRYITWDFRLKIGGNSLILTVFPVRVFWSYTVCIC